MASVVTDVENLFTQRMDYTSTASTNYYGAASAGSLTSNAVWRVKRETLDSSSRTIKIDWADGDTQFDNIWDNRTSLTYS